MHSHTLTNTRQHTQEVNTLRELEGTILSPEQVDALLLDLAAVLGHIRSAAHSNSNTSAGAATTATTAAQYGAHGHSHHGHAHAHAASNTAAAAGAPHAAIAEKARRLIAFACDQGWLAVASAVLPLAQACGSCAHDIVEAIHASTAQVGSDVL